MRQSRPLPNCRVRRLLTRSFPGYSKYDNEEGHRAAAGALTTILDSTSMEKVAESLPASHGHGTVTLLWLLSWSGDSDYFKTSSRIPDQKTWASGPPPSPHLAPWLHGMTSRNYLAAGADPEKQEIAELQRALANAAMKAVMTRQKDRK